MSEHYRQSRTLPKPLSRCIESVTRPLFKKSGLAGTRILTDWPTIVGNELSMRCAAEKLSFPSGQKTGGTLTIAVENGFATELQYMQPVILERLNAYFGYQAITRLSFSPRVLRTQVPQPVSPPRTVKLKPADMSCMDSIDDPELKAALKSLANTLAGQ